MVRWHVLHKVVVHTLQRHCRIPARNVVSPWQCIEALLEHASVVKLGLGGRTLASGVLCAIVVQMSSCLSAILNRLQLSPYPPPPCPPSLLVLPLVMALGWVQRHPHPTAPCINACVCLCLRFFPPVCPAASYNAFNALTTAFEKLSETLRDLKGVPLKIASVRASDAGEWGPLIACLLLPCSASNTELLRSGGCVVFAWRCPGVHEQPLFGMSSVPCAPTPTPSSLYSPSSLQRGATAAQPTGWWACQQLLQGGCSGLAPGARRVRGECVVHV